MLCDECKQNQATVKLVAVINGNKIERHLCASCVAKQRLQLRAEGVQSILSAMFAGTNIAGENKPALRCSQCGMTYEEFLKKNRLGCAQCYQDFRVRLRPLLARIHGRAQHVGRVPECVNEEIKVQNRMEQLRHDMDIAIACEDFEQAAAIRDELRAMTTACESGCADA